MASSSVACPPLGSFSAKYYSVAADGSCVRQSSFFEGKPVLNQGVGYSVILGFGAFFALFTSFLVWLEKRYVGSRHTSEWFNTAGRNVKTGLIASVIVSQWTWAATILQSSNVAWEYGISGPFWYASGATIQVLLFGIMAIEIKRKAPNAHTVCEIVKARWGTAAHTVFLVFCFMTNIIVTAMLLLGGSAVVNALTGVNIYAASFLIPLGVIVYTLAGGLKATFLASYIHSVIGTQSHLCVVCVGMGVSWAGWTQAHLGGQMKGGGREGASVRMGASWEEGFVSRLGPCPLGRVDRGASCRDGGGREGEEGVVSQLGPGLLGRVDGEAE